jgi:predicted MPP superfamily phosphohydrolase
MVTLDPQVPKTLHDETATLTRRRWLQRSLGTCAVAAGGMGLYAWQIEPHWVEVVHRDLPITGLPESLQGATLVQLSDVHIGPSVDDTFLTTWFRKVAGWKPEIVVFTGDFLTLLHNGSLPVDQLERVLETFPRGTLATIGILGNHDYGHGWKDPQAGETVVGIARNAGIEIVRNATRDVAGLQIVGFDDYWGPNFLGRSVLKQVDLELPTLVLCHNPDVADLEIWRGYRGWILSGHTHGGQCKAPFLNPPRLPIRNKRYSSGEISLADGRTLYVNRALGHSWPVRFNVRPEITRFRLVRREVAGGIRLT